MTEIKKIEKKVMAPRIPEPAYKFYAETWPSANAAAEWILSAFPMMYRAALAELRGKFTPGELKMMIDIANGSALLVFSGQDVIGQNLILSIYDSFRLYPGAYQEKWGVEAKEMVEKMKQLTRFQLAALEIWAGGFWAGEYEADGAVERHIAQLI